MAISTIALMGVRLQRFHPLEYQERSDGYLEPYPCYLYSDAEKSALLFSQILGEDNGYNAYNNSGAVEHLMMRFSQLVGVGERLAAHCFSFLYVEQQFKHLLATTSPKYLQLHTPRYYADFIFCVLKMEMPTMNHFPETWDYMVLAGRGDEIGYNNSKAFDRFITFTYPFTHSQPVQAST